MVVADADVDTFQIPVKSNSRLECSNFQQFKTCSQNNKFVPLQTLVRVFHTLSQQKTILHNDIQTPWQLYELWSARWNCLGVLFLNYTFQ